LTEADYDFSGVKSEELDTCDLYEYARESRVVRLRIENIRKQREQMAGKTGLVMVGPTGQKMIHNTFLMMLSHTSAFPKNAWQLLSDKDKQVILKWFATAHHVTRYDETWNNPPLTFATHEPDTMSLAAWKKQCHERLPSRPDTDPIKWGFFTLNMKYGRIILIEEFAKYLTHFEGKAMSETPPIEKELSTPKKLAGRKSLYDALNALAVMRLRYFCASFSEAQEKMRPLKNKENGMYYGYRNSANRACDFALRRFRELFGFLDSENPIHFSERWRGGIQK
jgi:hypothetical protein